LVFELFDFIYRLWCWYQPTFFNLVYAIWLPVFFLFLHTMNHNWVQESILTWLWPHFHLVYWVRQDSILTWLWPHFHLVNLVRQDLNSKPFNHESSSITTRPDWNLLTTFFHMHAWKRERILTNGKLNGGICCYNEHQKHGSRESLKVLGQDSQKLHKANL